MENKKASTFFFGIIAIIIGSALYKQFDLENRTFENPALSALYLIVLAASVYILIKNLRKK